MLVAESIYLIGAIQKQKDLALSGLEFLLQER